jgi:hypothetical protein
VVSAGLVAESRPDLIIKQHAPAAIGALFLCIHPLQLKSGANKAAAAQASFKTYSPQKLISLPDLKARVA